MSTLPSSATSALLKAKATLDAARQKGDKLRAALAEETLNDLLERMDVTSVTRNRKERDDRP